MNVECDSNYDSDNFNTIIIYVDYVRVFLIQAFSSDFISFFNDNESQL